MALLGGVLLISRPSFLSPPAEAAVEALNSSLTSSGDELTTAAAKYTLYHHHIARHGCLGDLLVFRCVAFLKVNLNLTDQLNNWPLA